MKRFLSLFVICMAGFGSAFASKIITDSIQSKVLNATVKYNVYLNDEKCEEALPVVYLLHGLGGTNEDWRGTGRMKDVADELIESGEARKMVIIMPCAGGPDAHKIWNGYFNMPGWSYETFFFTELMPEVEKKYNIISDKEHRAIMGLSMGGGGSVVYSQRHPDMFSSCYSMSGWFDTAIGDSKDPNDKMHILDVAVHENSPLVYVENADEKTVKDFRSVKWFFTCGDDDDLLEGSVRLHQLMRSKKIKSELRVGDGVHNWEYWHLALRQALPFASRNFAK